ncbi:MAG: hypothetical protein HC808_02330 [Candidatus Competibacteraceae bacterium]|nr:hypothetical protein [Candidatus Competibacteraceae bacterium]
MYDHIIRETSCSPKRILHIGDNKTSDIINAEKKGISAFYYPKATDKLLNLVPHQYSGASANLFFRPEGLWINYEYAKEHFLIRCMLATVANKYFDNPFVSFAQHSDFNSDPFFIGYYALGFHMFGFVKWLLETINKKNYNAIHFVARDGFLPLLAYNVLKRAYENAPRSNYIHLSRKSLIPAIIEKNIDYLSLDKLIRIQSLSAKDFSKIFLDKDLDDLSASTLKENGILVDKKFQNKDDYIRFINTINHMGFDLLKKKDYQCLVKNYLDQHISGNDAIVDIGYSATSQMIMAELGFHVDGYYIHTNLETADIYSKRLGFEFQTFYPFSPCVSGHIREYLISQRSPSCIGYCKNNIKASPVFEQDKSTYIENYLIGEIQRGAIDFIHDFTDRFAEHIPHYNIKNPESSMPYELLLNSSKDFDMRLFSECYFEDELFFGEKRKSLYEMWLNTRNYFKLIKKVESPIIIYPFLENRSRFINAIFYLIYDRRGFKERLLLKLRNRSRITLFMKRYFPRSAKLIRSYLLGN